MTPRLTDPPEPVPPPPMAKKKAPKKASSPAPSTPAPAKDVDLALVESLLRLMKESEATELDIDNQKAGLRVHLRRGAAAPATPAPVVHVLQGGGMAAAPMAAAPTAPVAVAAPAAAPAPAGPPPGTKEFKSPMVGTFYRAASPDAEPFASAGKNVKPDSTLCIIEAMKVMNEIKAECSGTVVEVLVENGAAVEFGQPLFLIKA